MDGRPAWGLEQGESLEEDGPLLSGLLTPQPPPRRLKHALGMETRPAAWVGLANQITYGENCSSRSKELDSCL